MALQFVSLFSGAGGLDLGLESAGWDCRYASDIDSAAIETIQRNKNSTIDNQSFHAFENTYIEQQDVRALNGLGILTKAGSQKGDIELLAGGPPCQSWSSAGHQHGIRDPRGQLFEDYVRIASEIDVRWIVFENVRGLLTARGPDGQPGSALALIRKTLLQAGFQTSVSLLNAADFGVPQRRVRLFIIGYRSGDPPSFPVPTHDKNTLGLVSDLLPWKSLGDCLSSIEPISESEIIRPTGKMALELKDVPPGSGVKSMGKMERKRPSGHWGYKQGAFVADPTLPARTVTASGQQDWLRDEKYGLRRLCPRECAALQTFPEDWLWYGRSTVLYRLIGNAVPPTLAKHIGQALGSHAQRAEDKKNYSNESFNDTLAPLPEKLEAAISYTKREERSNGASRRNAPNRRVSRIQLTESDAGRVGG